MKNPSHYRTCNIGWPYQLAVLMLLTAFFALPTAVLAQASADASTTSVQVAGQTVAIDRQTGKLRPPTPEEARALAAALKHMVNRSTEGLTAVRHPNGAITVDLQGRFQSVSVATTNPDGTVVERCVTNRSEARSFFKTAAAKGSRLSNAKRVRSTDIKTTKSDKGT